MLSRSSDMRASRYGVTCSKAYSSAAQVVDKERQTSAGLAACVAATAASDVCGRPPSPAREEMCSLKLWTVTPCPTIVVRTRARLALTQHALRKFDYLRRRPHFRATVSLSAALYDKLGVSWPSFPLGKSLQQALPPVNHSSSQCAA